MHKRPRGAETCRIANPWGRALCPALLAAAALPAHAFTVNITAGAPKTIYLQVGVGSFTGTYSGTPQGTPGTNPTVNIVSASVAAGAVGNGAAQAMSTDSSAANSFYDGFLFCNLPAQLYIGGFYRTTGNGNGTISVTATVPASLTDGAGDTIAFSQISWASGGNGPTGSTNTQPFPAGSFTMASQAVGSIAQNQWAESCWTFSYKNTVLPAAGTYTGRVLYTLAAP